MKRPETRAQAVRCLERASDILVPTVVESTHAGDRHWSIFDRLLKDRIIFLGTPIDDTVANIVIAQLLFLESEDRRRTSSSTSIARRRGLQRAGHPRHHEARALPRCDNVLGWQPPRGPGADLRTRAARRPAHARS